MATVSSDQFLDLLKRSGLVESDQLDKALAELQQQGLAAAELEGPALADKLVAANLITSWQRDNLLKGKHRGYFLGKYKLLGHLGRGGMSSVYLAEHTRMHHRVAVKVLPRSRVNDSSYLARFQREAQAAARLDHKNIVRAYDIDNENDDHYLVMEYVEGRDLQSTVAELGPLDFDTAADYVRQAAEGLEHAHQAGLVHRDIKPANLLVDQRGTVKVLDMGLARWEKEDKAASLTIAHEENVLGTADYLAPEQARDSHSVDKRADIYSLGCTLYFLLAGHPPFPDGTLAQRIQKHLNETPKSIYEIRPDAPQPLVDVCLRMMSKQPDARFQSAGEVAIVLAKWLQSRGRDVGNSGLNLSGTRRPIGPPPRRPAPPPRRDRTQAEIDTASNIHRETFKGPPSSTRPRDRSTPESSLRLGGSDLRLAGGSNVVGGSGSGPRSGAGQSSSRGSSIDPGKSSVSPGGSGSRKSGPKPIPVAKPIVADPEDQLGKLLDSALEQIGADPAAPQNKLLETRARRRDRGQALPSWFWLLLAGGVTVLLVLLLLVFGRS